MKHWIIKTNDGWIRLIDVLIVYKNSETFENIKKRIYKSLLEDNRYSNYDKEEVKKLIFSTERNEEDYYIWNVGGKEYRVELVNENIAEHTTAVLQDGEKCGGNTLFARKKNKINRKLTASEARHLAKPQNVSYNTEKTA